jgi:hypothetical protein
MPQTTSDPVLASGRAMAMTRCADAMLRGLGGTQIILRVATASAGDTNSQLGLTTAMCEDVPLSPAVVRTVKPTSDGRRQVKAMVSSGSVKAAAEARGVTEAETWLLCAQGIVYRNRLMHIDSVVTEHFAGSEYLYHIVATE